MIETECPYCNYVGENQVAMDDPEAKYDPKDGDLNFCIECGKPSLYHNKKLNQVDVKTLPEEIQTAIKEIESLWVQKRALLKLVKGKKK